MSNNKITPSSEDWYFKLMEHYKLQSSVSREDFFSIDLELLREKEPLLFLEVMAEYYIDFALFPDNDIINRFTQLGFSEENLRWFTPIAEFDNELTRIENTGNIEITKLF
jgi:hypothetical protein